LAALSCYRYTTFGDPDYDESDPDTEDDQEAA